MRRLYQKLGFIRYNSSMASICPYTPDDFDSLTRLCPAPESELDVEFHWGKDKK